MSLTSSLETLRKHPISPEITRTTTKCYTVPDTGFTIPVGMKVRIPVLAIHHDPDIYTNPECFIPERFSNDELRKRHSCSYLPFSDGPRNCIAFKFALTELKIGLVKLLLNFEFSMCNQTEVPLKYDVQKITLRPNQVWLNIKKLN